MKESEKQYYIKSSKIQVRPRVKEGLEDGGMVGDGENCRDWHLAGIQLNIDPAPLSAGKQLCTLINAKAVVGAIKPYRSVRLLYIICISVLLTRNILQHLYRFPFCYTCEAKCIRVTTNEKTNEKTEFSSCQSSIIIIRFRRRRSSRLASV
ncbi:hypothetical protein PV325_010481 [Microctonus aethiopoides]|nr:hypothetical protein PV325_010481 [Microctonus aethiopoides]KAK0095242.1 hypothetical protein PV326_008879 [Microctonus aethiopoides]